MSLTDDFQNMAESLTAPSDNAVAVTPNDSTDLANRPRALWIGGAGNLVVHMRDATGAAASVTFSNVAAGTLLPIRPSRVLNTGTTASSIVAVW